MFKAMEFEQHFLTNCEVPEEAWTYSTYAPVGENADPFFYAKKLIAELYADVLNDDPSDGPVYDVDDLILEDAQAAALYDQFRATGTLTTTSDFSDPLAHRHLMLWLTAVGQSQISPAELAGDFTTTWSPQMVFAVSAGPTVNPPTLPPPADIPEDLEREVEDFPAKNPDLYKDDNGNVPGFDCEDYADFLAQWLKYRGVEYDSIGNVWLTWPGSGHVFVLVVIDGYYYIIDPSSGWIAGPFNSYDDAVNAGWKFCSDQR
jgi:hypothetical protein